MTTYDIVYESKGMSAVLKCQANLNGIATWDWSADGFDSVKYSDGLDINPSLLNKSKLNIVGNMSNDEYKMQITNVSEKEEGIFMFPV